MTTLNRNWSSLLLIIFVLTGIYWGFLAKDSYTSLECDANGYYLAGETFLKNDLHAYLSGGPNREPLYSWIISRTMHLAQIWHIDFFLLQRIVQLFLLFLTQLGALNLLLLLNTPPLYILLAVAYLGISPALINTALSLYSEIGAIPFVIPLVILTGYFLWRHARLSWWQCAAIGLLMGINALMICMVKGILEASFLIFLTVFIFPLIHYLKLRSWKPLVCLMTGIICCLITFEGGIHAYKSLNLAINGQYAFTHRATIGLYGTTVERTNPMTFKLVLAGISYIPGDGLCRQFFNKETCDYWCFEQSDRFYSIQSTALASKGLTQKQIQQELVRLSLQHMQAAPLQYTFFWLLENTKMFFWESTHIGFVTYPPWWKKIWDHEWLNKILRLGIALLSLLGVICCARMIIQKKHPKQPFWEDLPTSLLLSMLFFIMSFSVAYAFCNVLTRYILPIAALYICAAAQCYWLFKKRN